SVLDDSGETAPHTEDALPVLVADDLPEMRSILVSALQQLRTPSGRRLHPIVVGNGREAVACARQRRFALALLDLRMPLMDGIQAAAIIRKEQPDCPILLYSAFAHAELSRRARLAGVTA